MGDGSELGMSVMIQAQRFHRLNTLNLRLTLAAWILSVFEDSSCWFKRSSSVIKRLEITFSWSMQWFSAQSFDRLNTLNLRLTFMVWLRSFPQRLESPCFFSRSSGAWDVVFKDETFPFHGVRRAKVNEITDCLFCDVHVIQQLLFVLREKCLHCFQFRDDRPMHYEVRHVAFLQLPSFVIDFQGLLGGKRDCLVGEFDLQALLVNFFAHSISQFFINFKYSTHQCVTFIAEIFSVFSHRLHDGAILLMKRPLVRFSGGLNASTWSVLRLSAQSFNRLNTLNFRLTVMTWLLCVFEGSSFWFKRKLSVFKRLENAPVH
jgi:hypothetical protein